MRENWYYATDDNRQHGPVPREDLVEQYRLGSLQPTQLVWREGMGEWKPARDVLGEPAAAAAAPATAAALAPVASVPPYGAGTLSYSMPQMEPLVVTARAMDMLRQTKPWVRFISVLIWITAILMIAAGVFGLFAGMMMVTRGGTAGRQALFMFAYFPLAILYIMPAVYLSRYATKIDDVMRLRRGDVFEQALEAQKSFWKFCGIAAMIMLVFYIALIVVGIFVAGMR